MKSFTVSGNDAGQRLDRFTAKAVPSLPSGLIQKYIRLKRIKVNGKGSARDYRLCPGDIIEMYINDEFFDLKRPAPAKSASAPKLDVVYEDENLLLVNKPAGMLAHSAGEWDPATLIAGIQAYLMEKGEWDPAAENSFTPALCNRIDRNTSGIVISVKNAPALREMNELIKERVLKKYYLCIVHGRPKKQEATLTGYIFKDAVKNQVYVRSAPEKGARTAVTRYRVLASKGGLSLLECELVTGRTHQIRAQLAAAGHPLLGDGKYGSERLNRTFRETKQALCSWRLVFPKDAELGCFAYLSGREFRLSSVPFAEKYFDFH